MKSEPARVWIASLRALSIEKALGGHKEFLVLGSGGEGAQTVRDTLLMQPDFLVLDGTLRGADGLWVLDQLRRGTACPPRVLFLCASSSVSWQTLAVEKGADAALNADCGEEAFLRAALQTAFLPLPRLAQPMAPVRQAVAEEMIQALGVRETFLGRRDMIAACAALACAPQLKRGLSQRLYPYVASLRGASPQAVEKAVRAAVEDTWLRGDLKAIQALFGMSVDAERGKPTNAEFLSMIAEHVRRETEKRLQIL